MGRRRTRGGLTRRELNYPTLISLVCLITLLITGTEGLDPLLELQWVVSYITVAPLGVKQQVSNDSRLTPIRLVLADNRLISF